MKTYPSVMPGLHRPNQAPLDERFAAQAKDMGDTHLTKHFRLPILTQEAFTNRQRQRANGASK